MLWIAAIAMTLANAAPSPAPGPSLGPPPTAAEIARCRARMPALSRADEGFRPYYADWLKGICEGDTARNRPFQSCILNTMARRGLRPDQTSEAHNECTPGVPECRASMRRLSTGVRGASGAMTFMNDFCTSMHDVLESDEERSCALRYAARSPLLRSARLLGELCYSKARECVDDLLTRGRFSQTPQSIEEIGAACHGSGIDPAWRSCILEGLPGDGQTEIKRGQGRFNQLACEPARREQRACIRDMSRRIEEKKIQTPSFLDVSFLDPLNDACKRLSEPGKVCLLDHLNERVNIGASRTICQFGSASMRECVSDFIRGRAPFDAPEFEKSREHTRRTFEKGPTSDTSWFTILPNKFEDTLGYRICGLSAGEGRTCLINSLKVFLRDSPLGFDLSALRRSQEACVRQMPVTRACSDFFQRNRFLIRAINEEVGRNYSIRPDDVCSIPVDEVRECVVKNLATMLSRRQTLDELIAACNAQFLRYMIDGVGTATPCP